MTLTNTFEHIYTLWPTAMSSCMHQTVHKNAYDTVICSSLSAEEEINGHIFIQWNTVQKWKWKKYCSMQQNGW